MTQKWNPPVEPTTTFNPIRKGDTGRRLWVEPRAVIGGALWSLGVEPKLADGHAYNVLADKIIEALKLSGYRIVREQTADELPAFAETKIDVNS